MFIETDKRARRRGFTLLEITLSVAILGMMTLAIYRFVATNLTVMRVSSEQNMTDARYAGLMNLLTVQWQNLPTGQGMLTGEPFKFNDRPRDEIVWVCGAGPGLLTRYAGGEFTVNMRHGPRSGRPARPGAAGAHLKRVGDTSPTFNHTRPIIPAFARA